MTFIQGLALLVVVLSFIALGVWLRLVSIWLARGDEGLKLTTPRRTGLPPIFPSPTQEKR